MSVHVYPIGDLIEHEVEGGDCVCGPDFEYANPETGETYPDGPVVTHHSLDGREQHEEESSYDCGGNCTLRCEYERCKRRPS